MNWGSEMEGVDDRVVIANVRKRKNEIATGQATKIKTGLVLQGGGMRGVYSIGALSVLEDEGLADGFDYVVGSSSGGINGAYFAAGQCHEAIKAYIDDLSCRKFIDFLRFDKIMDIDFLIEEVVKNKRRLDIDKVKSARATISVVLTDLQTGKGVEVSNRDGSVDYYQVLRGATAVPVAYNRAVDLGGRQVIDGDIAEGIPLFRAIEHGCTDILVILTSSILGKSSGLSGLARWFVKWRMKGFPAPVVTQMVETDEKFNHVMAILRGTAPPPAGIRSAVVWPSDPSRIASRFTTDNRRLTASAELGRSDMASFLA